MKHTRLLWAILACLCSFTAFSASIDLSGKWRFKLDPKNEGIEQEWFRNRLRDKIQLPGSLQEQGYGYDVDVNTKWTGQIVDQSWFTAPEYAKYREKGNVKVPFWLNPEKHYVGVAWYQRDFVVPADWKDAPLVLTLERTNWETTVYVDGEKIGESNALLVPHRYVLNQIKPGKHSLTIRVDNQVNIPVGVNAHSVSDHTQSNWNGITGQIKLEKKSSVYLEIYFLSKIRGCYSTVSPGCTIFFTHSLRISQRFPQTLNIVQLSISKARFQLSRMRASSSGNIPLYFPDKNSKLFSTPISFKC